MQHNRLELVTRLSFLRHMKLHEGGTRYKCGDCDSTFTRRSVLREHSWTVHGKEFDGKYVTVQDAPKLNISSALDRKVQTESFIQKWVSEGLVSVRPPIKVFSKLGQLGGGNADRSCNVCQEVFKGSPADCINALKVHVKVWPLIQFLYF